MPSPFPGMDPYLEDPAIWSDFHGTFLIGLRAELNKQLPVHYVARWDRHVWIDEPDGAPPRPLGRPDLFVAQPTGPREEGEQTAVLAAPATATMPTIDPKGKPYLKILDTRGRRVVTVIELLSPANKASGRDREAYLAKRQEYLLGKTNLVEMDLLRSGLRPPLEGTVPPADYYIVVSRAVDYPSAGVWPFTLRDPLPTLSVPLDPRDPLLTIALRPCLDRAYEEGRFGEEIDYHQPPQPPLTESDATWAHQLMAQRPN